MVRPDETEGSKLMRSRSKLRAGAIVLALAAVSGLARAAEQPAAPDPAKLEFFEKKIRPVLANHCSHCHSADTKPAGGLRVDDRNGLLTGGTTGPAVVPGKPAEGTLLKRVTQKEAKRRMPLEGEHLSASQVADLTKWIRDGAVWPAVKVPASLGRPKPEYERLKKEHWAWQPLTNPRAPGVSNPAWPRDDIDRFVLARLDAAKLAPVADAGKLALIRRVTFDLTGLPPTPEAIDAFLKDTSPGAFAKVVDRLLASPQFGEHWGRHWLDVARYGESTGPSRNIPYPHAWKYRDYVIDSVNADVPFDRFVREQVAGDLLPAADDKAGDRLKVATGFLALGVKDVNQRFKVRFVMDNVDEQIDVVTRSVLGLTASCARCHDHKFDPIPTTDYYALAGIFTSTENAAGVRNQMGGAGLAYYVPDQLLRLSGPVPPPPAEQVEKLTAEVAEAKKAWDAIRGTAEGLKLAANGQPTQRPYRLKFERLQSELLALTDPAQRGLAAHGVRDAKVVTDTEVRIRGEAEKLGPVVPRGFLTALTVPEARPINPHQSGRLELARWLTGENNALTPRVAVNRVWAHLFGRGLVSTVDNFGTTGDKPSHPELLDHLAGRFVRDGWSVKKLVRAIALSRAYQLSADATEAHRRLDPANALVWRHSPRRLTADEFRDATLAAAGTLDPKRPDGSPVKAFKMIEMRDNGPEAKGIHEAADKSRARSVYLPLLRGVIPRSLEAFDPVEQTLVTGSRESTTVPGQALFLLNSSFVRRQSLASAERVLKDPKATDAERVGRVFRNTLGRPPTEAEVVRVLGFLAEYESVVRQEMAAAPPAPKAEPAKPKKPDEPPPDPDQIDQTGETAIEEVIRPTDARTAAWLAFVQSLYASAEFRFVE
ncbi:MAG: Planctomycete cytochrome [Gemmataceae bacterium]|nr:Planctomycete cytochrome [Gemmataceae bacterium]